MPITKPESQSARLLRVLAGSDLLQLAKDLPPRTFTPQAAHEATALARVRACFHCRISPKKLWGSTTSTGRSPGREASVRRRPTSAYQPGDGEGCPDEVTTQP